MTPSNALCDSNSSMSVSCTTVCSGHQVISSINISGTGGSCQATSASGSCTATSSNGTVGACCVCD
jgi:hypothetical protein